MARQLRMQYEGAVYHILSRGNRREAIFRDDEDRRRFVEALGDACRKTGWSVHAYVLMTNHIHLVVETPQPNLVEGMRWLLGTYTARFNRRHGLVGHLFAGRYKSLLVDASGGDYLRTVCDYVQTKNDPTGYALSYGYDGLGNRTNLVAVHGGGGSNVLDVVYTYDARQRVYEIIGNGNATTFDYDALGRRTNAVWPNGTTASYAYDTANQLLSLVHASPTSTIASFVYGYDLGGNRTNMTTLEGVNAYGYDHRNWLSSAAYPDGSSQEFSYDLVGNRTELIAHSPTSVAQTAYTYGPANRLLSSVSAVEINEYAYDGAGRLTNQLVSGLARQFGHSYRGQMTTLVDTNGAVFTYAFDGDGNRISQSLNDCLTTRFVYDGPNVIIDLNSSNEIVHAYVGGLDIDEPIERIAFIAGTPRQRHVYHTDGLGSVVAMTDEAGLAEKTYAYEAFGVIRSQTGADVINRYSYTAREGLGEGQGWYFYRNRVLDPNVGRFTSDDPLGFVDGANLYGYVSLNPVMYWDPYGLVLERDPNDRNKFRRRQPAPITPSTLLTPSDCG